MRLRCNQNSFVFVEFYCAVTILHKICIRSFVRWFVVIILWNFRDFNQTQITHSFESLTVITSSGNKYNADKLIESSSFELNMALSMMQISSATPLRWILVMVRLNINFGMLYNADVIQTPAITICKCEQTEKNGNKTQDMWQTMNRWEWGTKLRKEASEWDTEWEWLDTWYCCWQWIYDDVDDYASSTMQRDCLILCVHEYFIDASERKEFNAP